MTEYWDKNYQMKVEHQGDRLILEKASGSDWSGIRLYIHNKREGSITIRSKEMAEQLHFMLGQMLSINN